MRGDHYHTVAYQRDRMWNALAFALTCLVGLGFVYWLDPESFFGYILGFGAAVGFNGFVQHRKYMHQLAAPIKTPGGVHSEGSHTVGP